MSQNLALELAARPDLRLLYRDVPFYRSWPHVVGLFTPEQEAILRGIPAPSANRQPDVVLRMGMPLDFAPSGAARTLVFGTTEFGLVPDMAIQGDATLVEAMARSDAQIVTPSRWSREGFLRSGAHPDRVSVVPHGFDEQLYAPPSAAERAAMRARYGLSGFCFLNVGALTFNKGMAPLLKAFAAVADRHADVRLVLKGLDDLYASRDNLLALLEGDILTPDEVERVRPRLLYLGRTMPQTVLADLYKAVDAYVSPYLAEGFNMPVLEAAACGLPIICTRGGSTDDFVTDAFALRIDASPHTADLGIAGDRPATLLLPDPDHLVALMTAVIERSAIAAEARRAGPAFVRARFTWRHVADRVLAEAFPPASGARR